MITLIVGAGISGFGAAKFLRRRNHKVRISERSKLPPDEMKKYEDIGAEVLDGGHDISHLINVSQIIASPGLPGDHLLLKAGRSMGLSVTSEIDLAMQEFSGILFGVTGTNGKSTTVGLVDHGLKKLGFSSAPAGNFGDPPTLMLAEDRIPENLVLELSSYQLEQSVLVHADCVMFTSFSNDHIARHGSEREYFESKWRLITGSRTGAPTILSADVVKSALRFGLKIPSNCYVVSEQPIPDLQSANILLINGAEISGPGIGDLKVNLHYIKGPHNVRNAVFAALGIHLIKKVSLAEALGSLSDYPGLPHRCEHIGRIDGRDIYNDSKSTNVESTLVALQSMDEPVILMMGGIGKGEPYDPILAERHRIALVLTFGPTGPDISAALAPHLGVKNFPTLASIFGSLNGIIKEYKHHILFSPGCASFDEFRNFGHRGEYFSKQILQVLTKKNGNKRKD